MFPKTSRDISNERPYENLIFLIFQDIILDVVWKFTTLVDSFQYTGIIYVEDEESEEETEEPRIIPVNVENVHFRNKINARFYNISNGQMIQKKVEMTPSKIFGGGAFFMLDSILHNRYPQLERLYKTSGLTSDIDIQMYTIPNNYQSFLFGNNPIVTEQLIEYIQNGLNEYLLSIDDEIKTRMLFLKGTGVKTENLRIDHEIESRYIRFNLNIDYLFNGVQYTQHMTDLFCISEKSVSLTGDTKTIYFQYNQQYERYLPINLQILFLNHLNDSINRYTDSIRQDRKHQEVIHIKCSNDLERYKWFLNMLSITNFIPYIPFFTMQFTNEKTPLGIYKNTTVLSVLSAMKKIGMDKTNDEILNTISIEGKKTGSLLYKNGMFMCDSKIDCPSSVSPFFVDIPFLELVRFIYNTYIEFKNTNVTSFQQYHNILTNVSLTSNSPCVTHETPSQRKKIIHIYEKLVSMTEDQLDELVHTHYGRRKIYVPKHMYPYVFGRIFKSVVNKKNV